LPSVAGFTHHTTVKKDLYLLLLSIVGMIASVLWLRWTHHAGYFLAFLGAMVLFALSLGDVVKSRWGVGKQGVPASIHAMALLLFLFGVAASLFGAGDPAYSAANLVAIPFFMAGCVYAIYFVFDGFGSK